MLSEFFLKKIKKAKYFSLGLETITEKGIIEMSAIKARNHILGYDYNTGEDIINKVETIEKVTTNGAFFCINEKILLFENQSLMIGDKAIHAKLLKVGDEMTGIEGKKIRIDNIVKIQGRYHFYRLKVSGNHTYWLNGLLMHNASRFWVGGSGNWDNATTTNWSGSSGGSGGSSVPTSSDDVTFDANSNATAYTVTTSNSTRPCNNIDFTNPASGALTFAGAQAISVSGNFTVHSAITVTITGTIQFVATATGKTVTTNGVDWSSTNFTFNGSGGGWTLQDNVTLTSKTMTLTAGTLDTNGKTLNMGAMSSAGSTTRSLTLGASTINLASLSNSWNLTSSGMTFSGASSTINLTGGATDFKGAGLTYGTVTLSSINGFSTWNFTGANSYANLSITTTATNKPTQFTFDSNQTITTLLTLNGASGGRLFLSSNVVGSNITFTAASLTCQYLDLMDITGAGAASWDIHAITGNSGDCGGNSSITFTSPTTQHFTNTSGGSWSTSGNWTSRVPLPQDTVIIDTAFTTSRTVTIDWPRLGASVDFTGATWTTSLTLSVGANATTFGSMTLISGLTVSNSFNLVFSGHSNATFTSHAATIPSALIINTPTGVSLTLADDLTNSNVNGISVTHGTFATAGKNITNNGAGTCGIIVTGTLDLGNGGTININCASTGAAIMNVTGTVLNAVGSTIKATDTGNNTLKFVGGGQTFGTVWFSRGASTGLIYITGSNTFTVLKDDGTAAHSLRFTNNTTTTIATGPGWQVSGTASNQITINSDTGGGSASTVGHTLTISGGGVASADYLNIQHSIAGPGNWYAGLNSTNNQGIANAGSGWIFALPPIPNAVISTQQLSVKMIGSVNRAGTY